MLPNIPSLSETCPDLSVDTYYVVLAPKGTDSAIVEELNRQMTEVVMKNPEYRTECEKMNYQSPWILSVDETKAELKKQEEHFAKFEQYLK